MRSFTVSEMLFVFLVRASSDSMTTVVTMNVCWQGTSQQGVNCWGIALRAKTENGPPIPACWASTSWVRTWTLFGLPWLLSPLNKVLLFHGVRLMTVAVVFQVCGWRAPTAPTSTPCVALTVRGWWLWLMTSVKSTSSSTRVLNPRYRSYRSHSLYRSTFLFTMAAFTCRGNVVL